MRLVRAHLLPLLAVLAGCAVVAARIPSVGDYDFDAGPAMDALVHGRISDFFAAQPLMGLLSLLIRLPFEAAATAADFGQLAVYRVGAYPCLLAAGAIGLALDRALAARNRPTVERAAVLALCVANPMTFHALRFGHPEELLGGALCVAAVWLAARDRPVAAGLALGAAMATKQWALLAVLPALLAAPSGRVRLLLTAGALAAALWLPMAVGNAQALVDRNAEADATHWVHPTTVWWLLASAEGRAVSDGVETVVVTRKLNGTIAHLPRPAILLAGALLALLAWRRRGRLTASDALGLLALVLLARCVLEPANVGYYHVPFLLALVGWEALRRDGLPVVSLLSALALYLSYKQFPSREPELTNALYLAWTVPLAAWLALATAAPDWTRRVTGRLANGAAALSRPRSAPSGSR